MFVLDSIGFVNTGLPLIVLGVLAVLLPRYAVDGDTRSHGKVAMGIALCAVIPFAVGCTISFVLTHTRGVHAMALGSSPELGSALWMHSRLSLMAAIVWAPILGLVWFGQAQRVEERRGRDIVTGAR